MSKYLISKNREKTLNMDKPMFTIGIIAELLNLTPKTLRSYENAKILTPWRSPKNRKLYSLNDFEKGKFIRYLSTEVSVNIAGIKIILFLLKRTEIEPEKYTEYLKEITDIL